MLDVNLAPFIKVSLSCSLFHPLSAQNLHCSSNFVELHSVSTGDVTVSVLPQCNTALFSIIYPVYFKGQCILMGITLSLPELAKMLLL